MLEREVCTTMAGSYIKPANSLSSSQRDKFLLKKTFFPLPNIYASSLFYFFENLWQKSIKNIL
jgi:hypothetical protein